MTDLVYILVTGLVALIAGIIIGKILFAKANKAEEQKAKESANLILKEAKLNAEEVKKEKIFEAKEKFIKLKSEFDEEMNRKKNQIISNENKLKQRDQTLSKQIEQNKRKLTENEAITEKLNIQLDIVNGKKEELDKFNDQKVSILEKISNLSAEEAKDQIIETLQDEARTRASAQIKDIVEEAKLTATKQAKKIVLETIQRTATEHAIENCVSVFNLESDDIKGKIIGREGRNIRALEAATGIEIIVDDTPEAIIISGFDPVRREIARLSLHRLVTDGRIHPARIEEIVEKTRKNIEEEIVEIGERTVIDLGIHGLHPELIKMVGRKSVV